jgi:hypothetical protein
MLVELLGGDAGVVVIDGRAVVADELAALRERLRDRGGDGAEGGEADPYRAALLALGAETSAAVEAFEAEWQHQRGERRPVVAGGQVTRSWEEGPASWTHRVTGERLGPWDYYGRLDAVLVVAWHAAVPVLEEAHGLAPGALPRPRSMTKPDPWPGDPPPLEGA